MLAKGEDKDECEGEEPTAVLLACQTFQELWQKVNLAFVVGIKISH